MLNVLRKKSGICIILSRARANSIINLDELEKLKEEMHRFLKSKGWHSGSALYPIDHPDLCYADAYAFCDKWDESTEYGRRRIYTLAHLNKYLEELRNA